LDKKQRDDTNIELVQVRKTNYLLNFKLQCNWIFLEAVGKPRKYCWLVVTIPVS